MSWNMLIGLLLVLSGCAPSVPPQPSSDGILRYKDYAEAPDVWDAVCHDPAYPFVLGEVISDTLIRQLEQIIECTQGTTCVFPSAEEVNVRCEQVLILE